jgi:3-oxoacyl-[acyl-carrier protein] reductase
VTAGPTTADPGAALVTGGSRGIGRAVVLGLARLRYRVHFTFLRDEAGAQETLRQAAEVGGDARCARLDAGDFAAMESWVGEIGARERIEVLVNNAGETSDALLAFQDESEWRRVLSVNLDGTRHACRAVLRPMIAERRGRIVNLASVSALMGREGQTAYAAAKGGVLAFTRSLARELAPFGITVNAVVPGPVDTAMWRELPAKKRESLLKHVPLGRVAAPEEVAAAVAYFISEAASYVTGASLRVDGGLGMGA